MRLAVFILLLVTAVPASAPAPVFLYASLGGENKILIFKVDPGDGKLTRAGEVPVGGAPGALAVDPERRFLFASLRSISSLASYRIDTAAGNLAHVSTIPAGADAAYVGVDRSGRFLLSAYYQAGKVMVHAINKDGSLASEPRSEVTTDRNAHSAVPDAENRFVFVPHTGPNAIFQFLFDSQTGRLTANQVPKASTPDRTGPRHLRFHPSRPMAYVANEQGSSVTGYRFDPAGRLESFQTLSTLPPDYQGPNTCAEIKVHPSGRFLYVSNRGHDSIATFSVDAATGRLTRLGHTPTEKTPRSFDLDPSGHFLYAAGQASGKIAAYRIDRGTGELKPLEAYDAGKQPSWLLAVPLPTR
jgi:6-phosphogluconolactonase (cycloisomerase 2 family)